MVSSMMRFAIASGSAPSKPYPASMRARRSFFAISRIAPSSTPLRPSFHCSATRMPYCSISSGCVVGTISTAIWLPFFASKSASRLSMRLTAPPDRVPVRSTTRAVSGGTATSALASIAARLAPTPPAEPPTLVRRRGGRRAREIHAGRLGDRLFVLDREIRFRLVTESHRGQIARKRTYRHVVVLHRLDVAVARHRDAVLRALQLGLQ